MFDTKWSQIKLDRHLVAGFGENEQAYVLQGTKNQAEKMSIKLFLFLQ